MEIKSNVMLCYTISELDYENALRKETLHKPQIVFIGRVDNIEQAKYIANTFTCQTYIRVIGKCIFIVCK